MQLKKIKFEENPRIGEEVVPFKRKNENETIDSKRIKLMMTVILYTILLFIKTIILDINVVRSVGIAGTITLKLVQRISTHQATNSMRSYF